MEPAELEALERRYVRMYLDDGEISDVRLLAVDASDHLDVIYEVIRVVVPGSATNYVGDAYFRVPISCVMRAEPIEPP